MNHSLLNYVMMIVLNSEDLLSKFQPVPSLDRLFILWTRIVGCFLLRLFTGYKSCDRTNGF